MQNGEKRVQESKKKKIENIDIQYDRIHEKTKIVTHISPKNSVKTIHKVHKPKKEIEKRRKRNEL